MSSPFSAPYDIVSDAYFSLDSPSAMHNLRRVNHQQRYNPYSDPHSSRFAHEEATVSKPTKSGQPARKRAAKPTPSAAVSADEIVYKNENSKNMPNPHEKYIYDPWTTKEHPDLLKFQQNKMQCWYFVLTLLMEPKNKNVIAWTGRGREFIITSIQEVTALWSKAQGRKKKMVQPDTFLRNLRTGYKRRIIAKDQALKSNRYTFVTEPCIHLNMSRERLSAFIAENSLASQNGRVITNRYSTPAPASFEVASPASSSGDFDSNVIPPPRAYPDLDEFFAQHLPIIDVNASDLYAPPASSTVPPPSNEFHEFDAFPHQPIPATHFDIDNSFWTRHPDPSPSLRFPRKYYDYYHN